jgi:hypothetical protein
MRLDLDCESAKFEALRTGKRGRPAGICHGGSLDLSVWSRLACSGGRCACECIPAQIGCGVWTHFDTIGFQRSLRAVSSSPCVFNLTSTAAAAQRRTRADARGTARGHLGFQPG